LPPLQKVASEKACVLHTIIIQIAQSAIAALQHRELFRFDAPVGDNSCKIRAIKIAGIASRAQTELFAKEIDALQTKLQEFSLRLKTIQEKTSQSMNAFATQHNLAYELDEDLLFLIEAHFLFSVKKSGNDETDPEFLMHLGSIARSPAKDWIHQIKVQLAARSCAFVQEEASHLDTMRAPIIQKMVSKPFMRSYEKRSVLPNLYVMETLLRRALEQQHLLVLKIKQFSEGTFIDELVLAARPMKKTFVCTHIEPSDREQAAIVIEMKRVRKKEDPSLQKLQKAFLDGDLLQLLFLAAAQDPQYLDGKRKEEIAFEHEKADSLVQKERHTFLHMQEMAKKMGLSSEHPTAFVIQHIFCDLVKNHIKKPWKPLWTNWMGDDMTNEPSWHATTSKSTLSRGVCY
jgi:hypothetical protein